MICDYLVKIQLGHFSKSYLDTVLQKWRDSPYDLYDAYTFCQVHGLIFGGAIAMAEVNIGYEPQADKEVAFHKEVLQRRDDKLFHGDFWGEKAEYDGWINWTRPTRFEIKRCNDKGRLIGRDFPVLEPREVPLEVGYTEGSRTLTHLRFRGALARVRHRQSNHRGAANRRLRRVKAARFLPVRATPARRNDHKGRRLPRPDRRATAAPQRRAVRRAGRASDDRM